MSQFETEGIILRSYSLAEADKIVVVLTESEGLIRGVAKGAKRLKSKFGGSLEPFSIVQISYHQKEERELVSIHQIELIKSFFDNASEPQFLQKFSYLVDLLIEFSPPNDPDERLYRMTKVCLETAAENFENLESIVVYFELWILRLGGYLPNWNNCESCKRVIENAADAVLQFNFHLICFHCRRNSNNLTVSAAQRSVFINAQKLSPSIFTEFAKKYPQDVKEISSILRRIISSIIGKDTFGEKILAVKI